MSLWNKLNLKDQNKIFVQDDFGVMASFLGEIDDRRIETFIPEVDFYLGFATTLEQVGKHKESAAVLNGPDPVVWVAYPKQSSKKYPCEFNRDTGWDGLGEIGYEPVRQVAIDSDWSALRFRKVGNIKSMRRSFAMTDEGKQKAAQARVSDH